MKKNNQNNKKQKSSSNILGVILFILMGGVCGFFGGKFIGAKVFAAKVSKEEGLANFLIMMIFLLIFMYLAIFIQMIVHEGGHFIFGKISGYHFTSFRIGNLMITEDNGKYKFKKFTIVGTGGQCLMLPPEGNEYDFPFLLYNLGGVINNIILSLICLLLYLYVPMNQYVSLFLLIMVIIGIAFALLNGIPMRLGGIANDGYNAVSLIKDKEARHAFWFTLCINGLNASGARLRDMPMEWFEFDQNLDWSNSLNCSLGGLRFSYLLDLKRYDDARALDEFLLENASGMLEIHKKELRCELMFFEMIGLCREEEIDKMYTKDLQKYIKATSSYVSRKRLMYAYELLVKHDLEKADKQLKEFEKVAKTYPFPGEIESERELVDFITEKASQN